MKRDLIQASKTYLNLQDPKTFDGEGRVYVRFPATLREAVLQLKCLKSSRATEFNFLWRKEKSPLLAYRM
ncbi:MAG: hypothetical protein CME32_01255 [Gimesia sp.]|nr:hypothetical protein [Gimesia sp.]